MRLANLNLSNLEKSSPLIDLLHSGVNSTPNNKEPAGAATGLYPGEAPPGWGGGAQRADCVLVSHGE